MITHGQAACIFYGQPITPENEASCEVRINQIPDVELCYLENDPTEPFLIAAQRILFFPFRYKRYPSTNDATNRPPDPAQASACTPSTAHELIRQYHSLVFEVRYKIFINLHCF